MQDCTILKIILKNLRTKTSHSAKRGIVVIDAGIATDNNLAMLTENGLDYICVSRSKLKDYKIDPNSETLEVEDKNIKKYNFKK
jgi:hypothetical protein